MNERQSPDLVISLLPGITCAEKISLLRAFDREEDFYVQSKDDIEKLLGRQIKKYPDMNKMRGKAEEAEAACNARCIQWVSWKDGRYPPLLREIYDPPAVVYYRGTLPNPEKPLLGMVGTRRPSPEGAKQAYEIARGMAGAGISVVSGLALGIDAMSHRGNLSGGVPGYAVLGSGADEIYPKTNRTIAKKILDSGGAVISEYPPGTGAAKWNFPARNRIISALSRSVIIVEAPKKSGALITAAFALEQGKDVWVASRALEHSSSFRGVLFDKKGTAKLADDGAEIIGRAEDVLKKWNMDYINESKGDKEND